MKKIFATGLVLFLALVMSYSIISTSYAIPLEDNRYEEYITLSEYVDATKIEELRTVNLNQYSLDELEALIAEQMEIQAIAATIAVSAEELGWTAESSTMIDAQVEWWTAYALTQIYKNQYDIKYEELEMAKWDAKRTVYPAATEIWLYMKELGWNYYVCAGIMGNLMTEVGGQTLNIRYKTDYNGYYGMCMWSKKYCSQVVGADLEGQCNYLRNTIKKEIDTFGSHYKAGFNFNSFLNLTNEKDAALAFAKAYERCGTGGYDKRQNNATVAYNYFVN